MRYAIQERRADAGSVTIQAKTMSCTVVHCTLFLPLSRPIPIMAELLIWVVETGNPKEPEARTSVDVVRFADSPSA